MFFIRQFFKRFEKYLKNTSWIFGEKVVGMVVAFAVTIVVARHFGPELFGVWSYALSLVGLFSIAGHMGLSGLVVRELVSDDENVREILGTAFILKLAGMCVGMALLAIYVFSYEAVGSLEFWVLLIVGSSLSLRAFSVIQFWFESQVQARFTAIAHLVALPAIAGYKVGLVLMDASLLLFATSSVLEAVLSAILLVVLYRKTTGIKPSRWCFSSVRARKLLKKGGLIFLGSIFAMVYLKVDQVMLRWLVGPAEVGVYAVAARLSEVWYFIPTAIVASFFPRLIQLRKQAIALYKARLQQVFDLLFVIALAVAIAVTLVSGLIITLLFGAAYSDSASILNIHIWAGVFIFMRAALSKWILIEDVLVFSLVTQGLGAGVNIILNLIFIPYAGGIGAAWATLLSYAAASYLSLLFVPKTREVFVMMSKAMLAPARYVYLGIRRITK